MGKRWVQDSFKSILLENCQAFIDSKDLGKNKAQTQLISDVAEKIRQVAHGSELPTDLNKVGVVHNPFGRAINVQGQCIATWFGNEARRVVGAEGDSANNSHTRGRTGNHAKQWNKRLVAAEIHSDRFNKIYRKKIQEYTGEGQANLRTYSISVTALLEELSDEELQECQGMADIWNKQAVPRTMQQK
jgi:hypothetical protein